MADLMALLLDASMIVGGLLLAGLAVVELGLLAPAAAQAVLRAGRLRPFVAATALVSAGYYLVVHLMSGPSLLHFEIMGLAIGVILVQERIMPPAAPPTGIAPVVAAPGAAQPVGAGPAGASTAPGSDGTSTTGARQPDPREPDSRQPTAGPTDAQPAAPTQPVDVSHLWRDVDTRAAQPAGPAVAGRPASRRSAPASRTPWWAGGTGRSTPPTDGSGTPGVVFLLAFGLLGVAIGVQGLMAPN